MDHQSSAVVHELNSIAVPVYVRALSNASPKPSSGTDISIGFLLASWNVILSSLPVRIALTRRSGAVIEAKQPVLVQVWIGCRSGCPASTLIRIGSVRLSP